MPLLNPDKPEKLFTTEFTENTEKSYFLFMKICFSSVTSVRSVAKGSCILKC